MKDFFKSDICTAIAIAILLAAIQGCRYANVKIEQAKQQTPEAKP